MLEHGCPWIPVDSSTVLPGSAPAPIPGCGQFMASRGVQSDGSCTKTDSAGRAWTSAPVSRLQGSGKLGGRGSRARSDVPPARGEPAVLAPSVGSIVEDQQFRIIQSVGGDAHRKWTAGDQTPAVVIPERPPVTPRRARASPHPPRRRWGWTPPCGNSGTGPLIGEDWADTIRQQLPVPAVTQFASQTFVGKRR